MRKTLMMTTAAITLLAGGQAQVVFGGENCMDMATDLVKRGGGRAMEVIEKLSANSALTADDLGISEEAFATANEYVSSGCAKDHLQKAVSAAGTASEAAGALKGLGF